MTAFPDAAVRGAGPSRTLRGGSLGTPALAAVRLTSQADGVAYAARLIHLALVELGAAPSLVELEPRSSSGPSPAERLRFLARLTRAQAGSAQWAFFTHLGLARAERWVPGRWRVPYAVFLHGIEVWNADLAPDRKAVLAGARLRISNSAYTARRIAEVHPQVGTIEPCPLALHPADIVAPTGRADAEVLARLAPRSVVIIGRMSSAERYKGHDELIECWPTLLAAEPQAQLVVVGMGDDRDRLMRKAAEAGLGDRVMFTGFVDDATRDALLARAALFAMPSRGEGFGIVYLQAMRAGTPCLGSLADAAGDVIVNGETGTLVDPADRQAMAAEISMLLRDESLRRQMGEAGRRRYEQEFTFERFRTRLGALLSASFGESREPR